MSWLLAHRVAGIAASHLHVDLQVSVGDYIDVLPLLAASDIEVMAQPFPRLFGAYFPATPRSRQGIILNSRLDETTRRHTAAHEWGHHVLHHGACMSDDIDLFGDMSPKAWRPEEKQAEAFAAWFLMPVLAVRNALDALGTARPRDAIDAYQISLILGTSYRGTVRHLNHLKLIPRSTAHSWAAMPLSRLRAGLIGNTAAADRRRVWRLGPSFNERLIHCEVGDLIVVTGRWLAEDSGISVPDELDLLDLPEPLGTADQRVFSVSAMTRHELRVEVKSAIDGSLWAVRIAPTPIGRRGILLSGTDVSDFE